MEVLYRTQPVFGAQPAAMVYPSNCQQLSPPSLLAPPSQPYTCYSFQASPLAPHSPPSRTPTPEYPARSRSNQESLVRSEGTTLQSVLRGEVPQAYSHFLSASSSSSLQSSSMSQQQQSSSSSSLSPGRCVVVDRQSPLGKRKCPFVEVEPSCSPAFMGRVPSTTMVLSPPPEDVQTEPMDLSFKRPSSSASAASSQDEAAPSPASYLHTFPPSPAEDHQGHSSEFSLLRNLLQVGKVPQQQQSSSSSSSPFHSASSPTSTSSSSNVSERSCDSPCSSECGYPTTSRILCGSTRVTLAKKNMYPVSARVSDWLVKVVQFAHSLPGFRQELTRQDQLTLLYNAWSRLLLLFMAESNFQFVVTPLRSDSGSSSSNSHSGESAFGDGSSSSQSSPDEPTMKSVEAIQTFIRKCQHMGVEGEEYHYMRMLVLFNSVNAGVSEAAKVDSLTCQIQKQLQMHVSSTRPRDIMHYSRLLMSLPSLYGISASTVERLFCRHIDRASSSPSTAHGDMSGMLRDLLFNMDR